MPPCIFRRVFRLYSGALVGLTLVASAHAAPAEDGRGVIRVVARVLPAPVAPPAPSSAEAGGTGDANRSPDERARAGPAETDLVAEIQTRGVLYRILRGERASPEDSVPLVVECVGN